MLKKTVMLSLRANPHIIAAMEPVWRLPVRMMPQLSSSSPVEDLNFTQVRDLTIPISRLLLLELSVVRSTCVLLRSSMVFQSKFEKRGKKREHFLDGTPVSAYRA